MKKQDRDNYLELLQEVDFEKWKAQNEDEEFLLDYLKYMKYKLENYKLSELP